MASFKPIEPGGIFVRKAMACLLVIILLGGTLWNSYANSAAPRILPDQMKVIFRSETGVELQHEKLVIELDPAYLTTSFTITYQLKNTTDQEIALPMWFIGGNDADNLLRVWDDGREIETKVVEADEFHIENWAPIKDPPFVTPKNSSVEDRLHYYGQASGLPGVTEWQLILAPSEEKEIIFRYVSSNGYLNHSDYFSRYMTQYYALSPATFFTGEAIADIELRVPESAIVGANLPFNRISGDLYRLDQYELGKEDLYLTFLNSKELMLGFNSRNQLLRLTLPIALIAAIVSIIFRRNKGIKFSMAAVSAAVISLNLIRPSYGMVFMAMFLLPVMAGLSVIILIGYVFYKKKRR
jgi:hypothetical protein